MECTASIVVDRPLPRLQAAITDQHRLMAWSVWPQATGYSRAADGTGRSIGSAIVFHDPAGVRRPHVEDRELLKAHVENKPRRTS